MTEPGGPKRGETVEVVGEEPTGPFALERPRESGPPSSSGGRAAAEPAAPQRRLELVMGSEPPPPPMPDPGGPSPTSSVHNRVATSVLAGRIPFGSLEERMIASLARTMGLTGLGAVTVGATFVAQWAYGLVSVPGAMAAILAGAIGLWTLLAAFHFQRVVARDHDDAHQLVAAFSNLRSILILKTIGFFLALALACFALSILASLFALL